MEERYTFGTMHLGLLDETREHLEAFGHTCRVEEMEHHGTKLYTLVATPPKRPNREARGCYLT
jgi:hypothetical protein